MYRIFQVVRNLFQNLYAKLIASAAIGVLLVGGMILNEQWSNSSIARSNESSRNQNAVVKEVLLAQQNYLRGQIQRRNLVLAHNLDEVEEGVRRHEDGRRRCARRAPRRPPSTRPIRRIARGSSSSPPGSATS